MPEAWSYGAVKSKSSLTNFQLKERGVDENSNIKFRIFCPISSFIASRIPEKFSFLKTIYFRLQAYYINDINKLKNLLWGPGHIRCNFYPLASSLSHSGLLFEISKEKRDLGGGWWTEGSDTLARCRVENDILKLQLLPCFFFFLLYVVFPGTLFFCFFFSFYFFYSFLVPFFVRLLSFVFLFFFRH